MPSAPVIDFDRLLAPISEEAPAGIDLRADASPSSPFYRLRDARDAARDAERRQADEMLELGPEDDPPEVAPMVREWRTVIELSESILAERSKDLTVAALFVEGLVRDKGFPGLRDGCRLIARLVDRFWDDLHPLPNEYGFEDRVGPIGGMNGAGGRGGLLDPVRNIALTDGASRFAAWHHQMAHRGAGLVTVEQFDASQAQTSPSFYQSLVADIEEALAALSEMTASLAEKMGADAPGTYALREAIEDIDRIVRAMVPDTEGETSAPVAPGGEAVEPAHQSGAAPTAPAATAPGGLRTREDAFTALATVAAFFRRTEPHSPIAYTLEELIRRGRMPLHELLRQLIPDDMARETFIQRAGMRNPEEEAEG